MWWCIVLGHTHLGKGPLKAYYEGEIAKKDWTKVTVRTLWLQAEDYPLLLGMGGCEGGGEEWEGGWYGGSGCEGGGRSGREGGREWL